MKVKKALKEIKKHLAKKIEDEVQQQINKELYLPIDSNIYDLYKKIHDAHFKI